MASVPTADISVFLTRDENDTHKRPAAAKQLADSVRVHGCAAITGHGLPEADLQDVFRTMRSLFDLPLQEKMLAPHPDGPVPHRGYLAKTIERSGKLGIVHSKSESEKAFYANAVDWKVKHYPGDCTYRQGSTDKARVIQETYDIGHEDNKDQENIWLPDGVLPGFRPYMVRLYERLTGITNAILEGLMLGMDLEEGECEALRKMHAPTEHQLRLAHYLPMTSEDQKDPNKIRLAAHRDFSSYTLLFQESTTSGLEFQNRDTGEYMPAAPTEGVLYLNIGDLMERYSNGFYPSAMHRVAIEAPARANGTTTIPGRLSIPFFTLVGFGDEIYPMPSRVEKDGKANYEPVGFQALSAKIFAPVIEKGKA